MDEEGDFDQVGRVQVGEHLSAIVARISRDPLVHRPCRGLLTPCGRPVLTSVRGAGTGLLPPNEEKRRTTCAFAPKGDTPKGVRRTTEGRPQRVAPSLAVQSDRHTK